MKKLVALLTAVTLSATVLAAQAEKEAETTAVEVQTRQASAPVVFEEVVEENTAASDVAASAASVPQ
ncbi:hypothetical protein [Neisseria iguanae]|uniref:Uncharacterized protein n=1 Tax=Neisseria iguanae TaxID=90242 RepID=A0A2P7TZ67_9NEIS|nr:hypothetical protein [Neisseria iguanae]PSJ79997.1 hypothetical protein C7N83_08900 [Neisseria iguanae]